MGDVHLYPVNLLTGTDALLSQLIGFPNLVSVHAWVCHAVSSAAMLLLQVPHDQGRNSLAV